ncbi:MAG: SH3 domain-containing protein [Acidobacteriota bacterium]
MKQCPKCGTTYTDSSLTYCLADGAVLADNAEADTFTRGSNAAGKAHAQMRVMVPQNNPGQAYIQPPAPVESGSWLKIILLVGLILGMLLVAAGVAGALLYFNKDSRRSAINSSNAGTDRPTPTPTPTPNSNVAVNAESEKLRDQIANLEKRLDEQKNTSHPATVAPAAPDQPTTTSGTAKVNSPGDGFLAMRTLPSSDVGDRVQQIPNGSLVTVGGCLPRSRVGGKAGRWCRASYNGYSGWVFDAWLSY